MQICKRLDDQILTFGNAKRWIPCLVRVRLLSQFDFSPCWPRKGVWSVVRRCEKKQKVAGARLTNNPKRNILQYLPTGKSQPPPHHNHDMVHVYCVKISKFLSVYPSLLKGVLFKFKPSPLPPSQSPTPPNPHARQSLSLSVIERLWGNPAGRSARSARGLTRDAKAVSEKPEGTSQCGYQSLSLFAADLLHPARERAKRVIVGSEVRGYDSPKLIRGKKPNVRPFFKKNLQLKKLVSITEPNVRPFFKKNFQLKKLVSIFQT